MANGIEVAQAFVTIIPSMKDSQKTIAKEMDADAIGHDAGEKIGSGIHDGISAKAVVIGSLLADAISGVVSKAIDIGKDLAAGIYDGFASNEQLAGGMQKLFGDDAQTVIDNANQAFMTAGMSANDYMEGVTSFAASLVNDLGGDTEEAARLANVAMMAMSDNVNTFGTDAQSVQNAIQGLAKGNYSMLDNLSLGYAGSQQGMLDLINASGVLDHELTKTSELADVGFGTMLEAIQAVQEQTGIAGTTINEAMGTLEGSATAASAAWENVLTSIGTGDPEQVKAAAAGLVDTLFGTIDEKTGERSGGLIENVVGLVTRSASAIAESLPDVVDALLAALPPEIAEPITEALDTIGEVAETVIPMVTTAIGQLVAAFGDIAPVVAPLLPIIAGALGAVKIVGVITSIVGAVSSFISVAGTAISMISGLPALISAVVTVMGGPVTIIAAIVGAIIAFVATNEDARKKVIEIWNKIKTGVKNAVSFLQVFIPQAWNKVRTSVVNTVNALKSGVTNAWNALKSSVTTAMNTAKANVTMTWNAIKATVTSVVDGVKSSVTTAFDTMKTTVTTTFDNILTSATNIFNAIKTAITTPIDAAKDAVSGAIDTISQIITGANLQLPHFALPHFVIYGGHIPWGIGGKGDPPSIDVEWYARGGYVDGASLVGVGERGGEFIWPSYAPYLDQYADALTERMGGGVTVNLTYNGSGDPSDVVNALTRSLKMMRMTGAI